MPVCVFDIYPDGTTTIPQDDGLTGKGTYRWWHFEMTDPSFADWVHAKLPPIPAGALLQTETRPRCDRYEQGLILNLRGINMNVGAAADEMISLRLWVAEDVVITVRRRKVFAIEDIRNACIQNTAPSTSADFLEHLIDGLLRRVQAHLEDIETVTDIYEAELENQKWAPPRDLPETRRSIIRLRRYLEPQRAAMDRLAATNLPLLPAANALELRELANRSTITVEHLDELRDRLITIQDEHDTNVTQRQARHGYVLSVAAAIFLPLGLITGLFGVNLNGIIGAEAEQGFAILCLFILLVALGLIAILRWLRWI